MKFSEHTFFIMEDGTIKCCGYNQYGQLGLGFSTPSSPYGVSTVTDLPLTGVKDTVYGGSYTFFIMQDGTVKVCGRNGQGQLGLGHRNSPVSTVTDLPFTGVKNIVCGNEHTFFIMQDGTIKVCGRNSHGQLGLGFRTPDPYAYPTVTELPFTGVKDIVCGLDHTFFIMQDGTVKVCGRNSDGQLGLGHANNPVSTVTDLPFTGVKNIVCGAYHTFFIMQDGTIKVCGSNSGGQLGLGHANNLVSTVTDLPLANVKKVVCGGSHTIFVMEDGTLKGCGDNYYGQLGLGHTNTPVSTVTDLPLTGVKDIVCGYYHTFFIMEDGTLKGCGYNRFGQLGIENTAIQPSPVTIPGISNEEPTPPVARNVTIIGEPQIGQILIGSYEYYDENDDLEGESTFRWLRADTENGEYTAIPGATGTTYTITEEDIGKYIKFEVTPVSL